jgi:hypothetical protein
MTYPAIPSYKTCGLIMQHVQLLKAAVGAKLLLKNNDASF